jgi:hypothetical protein
MISCTTHGQVVLLILCVDGDLVTNDGVQQVVADSLETMAGRWGGGRHMSVSK